MTYVPGRPFVELDSVRPHPLLPFETVTDTAPRADSVLRPHMLPGGPPTATPDEPVVEVLSADSTRGGSAMSSSGESFLGHSCAIDIRVTAPNSESLDLPCIGL